MTTHNCGSMCNPGTCKVKAGEAVENRQAGMEMDDGKEPMVCGTCRSFDPYLLRNDDTGFCEENRDDRCPTDTCDEWEANEF